jgi:hypothetical protein
MSDQELRQIKQLPEGYYFKVDMTARVAPAGFVGLLPLASGTIERLPEDLAMECRGPLIPATEYTTDV